MSCPAQFSECFERGEEYRACREIEEEQPADVPTKTIKKESAPRSKSNAVKKSATRGEPKALEAVMSEADYRKLLAPVKTKPKPSSKWKPHGASTNAKKPDGPTPLDESDASEKVSAEILHYISLV